jgi:mRNA-degrading endonuclease RelE of RelBE toxin-antitoxin system
MPYEVIVPERIQIEVNKRLKDKELIRRFYKRLRKLERDPTSHGKPLRKPLAGIWEIYFERRWRVLFEIRKKKVVLLALKHKDEM